MLKRSALAAFALAGFASGAFAQTQPSQPSSSSSPSNFGSRPWAPIGAYDTTSNQAKLWRQSMAENSQSEITPEQRRRAQKAVALIKANRCEDAYNTALTEQDNRLALNIAVACKAHLRQ